MVSAVPESTPNPNRRRASSRGSAETTAYRIGIILYQLQDDNRPQILVENVTIRDIADQGSFKTLQGEEDLDDDRIGHNAYQVLTEDYRIAEDAVKLMEVNPKVFLNTISSAEAIANKGFRVTHTRYVKVKLLALRARFEHSPFTWLSPVDVVNFAQSFRKKDYREVLNYFDFQVP